MIVRQVSRCNAGTSFNISRYARRYECFHLRGAPVLDLHGHACVDTALRTFFVWRTQGDIQHRCNVPNDTSFFDQKLTSETLFFDAVSAHHRWVRPAVRYLKVFLLERRRSARESRYFVAGVPPSCISRSTAITYNEMLHIARQFSVSRHKVRTRGLAPRTTSSPASLSAQRCERASARASPTTKALSSLSPLVQKLGTKSILHGRSCHAL